MPQYLVISYLPDDFDPSKENPDVFEKVYALNREMIAAGVRKFACGLSPAPSTKTLRKQADGKVLVTDGPYMETKEQIAGLLILEADNLDAALAWARRGTLTSAPVEVREILFFPAPDEGQ